MAHFTSAMHFAPVHGDSVCIILYVIKSHCDLSVLAVSLMSLKKKLGGWVG